MAQLLSQSTPESTFLIQSEQPQNQPTQDESLKRSRSDNDDKNDKDNEPSPKKLKPSSSRNSATEETPVPSILADRGPTSLTIENNTSSPKESKNPNLQTDHGSTSFPSTESMEINLLATHLESTRQTDEAVTSLPAEPTITSTIDPSVGSLPADLNIFTEAFPVSSSSQDASASLLSTAGPASNQPFQLGEDDIDLELIALLNEPPIASSQSEGQIETSHGMENPLSLGSPSVDAITSHHDNIQPTLRNEHSRTALRECLYMNTHNLAVTALDAIYQLASDDTPAIDMLKQLQEPEGDWAILMGAFTSSYCSLLGGRTRLEEEAPDLTPRSEPMRDMETARIFFASINKTMSMEEILKSFQLEFLQPNNRISESAASAYISLASQVYIEKSSNSIEHTVNQELLDQLLGSGLTGLFQQMLPGEIGVDSVVEKSNYQKASIESQTSSEELMKVCQYADFIKSLVMHINNAAMEPVAGSTSTVQLRESIEFSNDEALQIPGGGLTLMGEQSEQSLSHLLGMLQTRAPVSKDTEPQQKDPQHQYYISQGLKIPLPPGQTKSSYEMYIDIKPLRATNNKDNSSKKPWQPEEVQALLDGIDLVKGGHWSQIIGFFGESGTYNNKLRNRGQIQLKDKARNIKISFQKAKVPIPCYINSVTGDVNRRMAGQQAKREASRKAQEDATRLQGQSALGAVATLGTPRTSGTPSISQASLPSPSMGSDVVAQLPMTTATGMKSIGTTTVGTSSVKTNSVTNSMETKTVGANSLPTAVTQISSVHNTDAARRQSQPAPTRQSSPGSAIARPVTTQAVPASSPTPVTTPVTPSQGGALARLHELWSVPFAQTPSASAEPPNSSLSSAPPQNTRLNYPKASSITMTPAAWRAQHSREENRSSPAS